MAMVDSAVVLFGFALMILGHAIYMFPSMKALPIWKKFF
jgi:hypothetical protein